MDYPNIIKQNCANNSVGKRREVMEILRKMIITMTMMTIIAAVAVMMSILMQ